MIYFFSLIMVKLNYRLLGLVSGLGLFYLLFMVGYLEGWVGLGLGMGLDNLSYLLILLSLWIFYLIGCMGELWTLNFFNYILMDFLMIVLLFVFLVMNMFMFYLFFEGSMIPISLLIVGWGGQFERLGAMMYLIFYMLINSFPMIFVLAFMWGGGLMLDFGEMFVLNDLYFYVLILLMFLVKLPLFILHLWLPSAHVEAPVSGSMILAGILLKLGGYGLFRFMKGLVNFGVSMNLFVVIFCLVGMFFVSLSCLCQVNMKCLVAYSSVVHMCMSLLGFMTVTFWGVNGMVVLLISHGLCSSGLFYLVGVVYGRVFSRSLLVSSGMMGVMPMMSLSWFLLSSTNLSAPPSLNLLGELEVLGGVLSWCWFMSVFMLLVMFFGAMYSLYLYSFLQHGELSKVLLVSNVFSGELLEYYVLCLHWVPLNLLFLLGSLIF